MKRALLMVMLGLSHVAVAHQTAEPSATDSSATFDEATRDPSPLGRRVSQVLAGGAALAVGGLGAVAFGMGCCGFSGLLFLPAGAALGAAVGTSLVGALFTGQYAFGSTLLAALAGGAVALVGFLAGPVVGTLASVLLPLTGAVIGYETGAFSRRAPPPSAAVVPLAGDGRQGLVLLGRF